MGAIPPVPPPTGNQLRDFAQHLAEKTPQGSTQADVQYHIDHHAPGADKANAAKFQAAVFTQQNFQRLDTSRDGKVQTGELNAFASKLAPGPPPPPPPPPAAGGGAAGAGNAGNAGKPGGGGGGPQGPPPGGGAGGAGGAAHKH